MEFVGSKSCSHHRSPLYIETSCGAVEVWMSFDCGLRGMTKWHHNSLDNNQSIMYSNMLTCMCICVYVCLINTSSMRALNWAECEIWQAWVGLCGLPLHSNKTETCWHEYQMSEGACWEPSSITIWMIVAWKGRQSSISIFQYPGTDGTTQGEAGCLAWGWNVGQMSPVEQRRKDANE